MSSVQRTVRRPLNCRLAAVGVLASGALLLAACGSNDRTSGTHHGSTSAPSAAKKSGANPAPGASNDADVTFAQSMIPHHEQAVEMAKLADGRASDTEIKTLAAAIEKAQGPEITTMRAWLKAWGAPASSAHGMPGMDHGSGGKDGMSGMMSAKDMTDLKAAKGKGFDRKFAQMMIGHHNGAITMAKDEQRNGRNATAKKLAGDVIKNQTAEVAKMNKILDRL
ncbi:DUF305 domain-containing protein [Streptomyces sioyaensis]|uniref:DUF305 domain-containing protein n=1 Tax=Streptomyces sioyaensis TaxID=67364 RepID=A0A4Q1QU38_9ACTN|nr:DUF305 domain-containing protein [Streptomyces sioyaensis]MBM4792090.1 DUF305 domain-containing protein [Streptomyces sioyaensis]RXS59716.1 DUF305 domain-containing protein [Streptomyces sioyaensis]